MHKTIKVDISLVVVDK